jgi:hypothetical protein
VLAREVLFPLYFIYDGLKRVREIYECGMGKVFLEIRTRVQEGGLDGGFRSEIREVESALGSVAVVILTTKTRC